MNRSKQLGEDKVSSLLWKFSIPAIIGMLVNALYNVVDRMFIGQGVGTDALAGITISFPLMIVLMAFGMLVGIGGTSLISIRLGEQRKEDAERILGNSLVLLIIISLTLSILGSIFMDRLLIVFGASAATLPYAQEYLRIILFGAVFQAIGFGLNNMIRADGSPKVAMFTMLIGALLNTALDPLFIFVFKMGIAGAAWATIISQAVSAIWVLAYFLGGKSMLKIHRRNLRLQSKIVWGIMAIGVAPFSMQIVASVLNIIMNNSLVHYGGDLAISAMGIINSIAMLILMPIFGINQGAQPIIGYNYGAKQYDRVKLTLRYAITAATAIVVVGFVVAKVFPEQLIMIFNRDPKLVAMGSQAIRIFLTMLPIIGFQIVGANYFQAVGKPRAAMFLSLSRQVVFLIPALLILPRFFGLNGVFMAGPVGDFFSSLVTGLWLWREVRQLNRKHVEQQSLQEA
jgi:putative MATE family efflux protein